MGSFALAAALSVGVGSTHGLLTATAPPVTVPVGTTGHGTLLQIDPDSISLGNVTLGKKFVRPIAKVTASREDLPLRLGLTGDLASIVSVSLSGDTVMAQVYATSPSTNQQLTGVLDVTIGNGYDVITVPMSATVVADQDKQCSGEVLSSCAPSQGGGTDDFGSSNAGGQ